MKEVSRILYKKEEEERQWLPEYKEFNSKQMAKMTHLEEVSYSVWQRGDCKKLTNPALILFNYKKRNPLTKEAETIFIDGSTIK